MQNKVTTLPDLYAGVRSIDVTDYLYSFPDKIETNPEDEPVPPQTNEELNVMMGVPIISGFRSNDEHLGIGASYTETWLGHPVVITIAADGDQIAFTSSFEGHDSYFELTYDTETSTFDFVQKQTLQFSIAEGERIHFGTNVSIADATRKDFSWRSKKAHSLQSL